MKNLVVTCIAFALLFMIAERILPARPLAKIKGWWPRVLLINAFYAALVILGGVLWDPWFSSIHIVTIFEGTTEILAGACAYVVLSFVYYWWHRWRHESKFLWRFLHQLHHTPARIETITSLYKHPLEIIVNTILTSTVCYIIMGLSVAQTSWTLFFLAIAEYIYHINIRTPRLLGYFIQRPEMHRVHHQRGLHRYNYSDLPIWDMIFGTYHNPIDQDSECGMGVHNELQIADLLKGKSLEDNGT